MRGLVALLLGLLTASLAGAAEELQLPPVTRTTLANGMRVVVAEYHELPLLNMVVFVGAGAAQDPHGKEGLAMLTANSLKRGVEGMSADELARTYLVDAEKTTVELVPEKPKPGSPPPRPASPPGAGGPGVMR